MAALILKVAPVLIIFVLGIILKRIRLFSDENADSFLKLVFYVSFPASILLSITNIRLSSNLVYLPVSAALIIIICFSVALVTGRLLKLPTPTFGVFLVGSIIINTAFTFPFFLAVYGEQGFARASLFDFGNGIMALTLGYYIAVKYGGERGNAEIIRKFLSSSPLWALFAAVIINLTHIKLPLVVTDLLKLLSSTLIPLFTLSLGIRFNPAITKLKATISVISIRMLMGFLLGYAIVSLFRLEGLDKVVVLVSSSAPIGLSTLTFATMENLDTEFAASLVSVSILIGIFITPVLILLLS